MNGLPINRRRSSKSRPPIALFVWMVYVSIFPFFKGFAFFQENKIFNQIEELLMIFLLPLAFKGLRYFLSIRLWGRLSIVSFIVFLFLGILGGLLSDVSIKAMILQLLLELKVIIVLLAFIGAGHPDWIFKHFLPILKGLMLISIPLILFQFTWPDTFDAVFPTVAQGKFHLTGGQALHRAVGTFRHSGLLAFVSSSMAALFFIRMKVYGFKKKSLFWFLIAVVLLVTTLERQEIAGFFLLLPLLWLIMHRTRIIGFKFVSATCMALVGLIVIYPLLPTIIEYLHFTIVKMSLLHPESSNAARVVFYFWGTVIAIKYFPIGYGIGGFGGHAANIFNSPIYAKLGFHNYPWYKERMFMTDTFWPHILGETGLFGVFAYLVFIGSLIPFLWQTGKTSESNSVRLYSYYTMFSVLYLLTVSLTAAAFLNLLILMVSFMFLGFLKSIHSHNMNEGVSLYTSSGTVCAEENFVAGIRK